MADVEELDDDAIAAQWEAEMAGDGVKDGDIASEWEAMADKDDDPTAGVVGRVLNQDEIDSLLGFDGDDSDSEEQGTVGSSGGT